MSVKFQDYYEILGVGREADEKEIKAAYRSVVTDVLMAVADTTIEND